MSKTKSSFSLTKRLERRRRVRGKISGTKERPRLSVFRSNRFMSVQIIDDESGKTLLGLSNQKMKIKIGKGDKDKKEQKPKVALANQLGVTIAEQALAKKIKQVVFDRQGYRYAGRVRALADGARAGGLIF